MSENKFLIPSLKIPFQTGIIVITILIPIFIFLLFPIIGVPGSLVLSLFWVIYIIGFVNIMRSKGTYAQISDSGIVISQNRQLISLNWDEIEKMGFQAVAARRVGVIEATPCLALKLVDSSLLKLANIKFQEFGFLKNKALLESYMSSGPKSDIYINMKFVEEKDTHMLEFLASKSSFVKSLPPLIKTSDKSEYDKIVTENFVRA